MTEDNSAFPLGGEQFRTRARAVLTVCCIVAVLLAATVVPAVSSGGLGQSPLGSIVPQPNVDLYGQSSDGAPTGRLDSAGRLGALDPGKQTGVGGSLADENQSSAFRSQNAETHFTVQSSASSYWRTGAYDAYTESGWKRTGDRDPYTGSVGGDGIAGQRVDYRVTLARPAAALPSVWRADTVSRTDSVFVTDQRAFEVGESVPAGTTYSGVSYKPPRDPAVLRTAGRDYPDEIERRYTALPDDAQTRVGGFTENLTADADSPYETATRIESWLESNKNYSLDAAASEDGIASQFVFEMEAGYCEHFATAMTVMLRSQGVPARYAVGYSTGERVAPNTYEVRGMNAHAWVEVYFPEVGWVKFDPTPGQARLDAEQQAFERQEESGEYDVTEQGSPEETFSASASTDAENATTAAGDDSASETSGEPQSGTPTGTATASTSTTAQATSQTTTTTTDDPSDENDADDSPEDGASALDVALNRTPVPGAAVTATVTRDGDPVARAVVRFNGERIGVTDESGTVTGVVPYARKLEITVSESTTAAALGDGPLRDGGSLSGGGPPFGRDSPSGDDSFSGGGPLLGDGVAAAVGPPPRALTPDNETNGSQSYSLTTNVTLTVSGDRVTGGEVLVTATIRDVPVRDAQVRVGNRTAGRTDRAGRLRVTLPESPGNVTVTAERGSASGRTTVELPELRVSVEPTLPLALPGTGVEVTTRYGDDGVAGVPVSVGDERVGTTDVNGTLTASLPFSGDATVAATRHGQSRTATVSGLFVNLLGVVAGALALVGGLGFGASRRGLTPRRLASLLVAGVRALPRLAVAALFAVVARVERVLDALAADFADFLAAVRRALSGDISLRELLGRFRTRLRRRARAVAPDLGALRDAVRNASTDESAPEERPPEAYRTVRAAWDDFLAVVSVRRPGRRTPGELAAHAVGRDGLPADAVGTLRDAFRDVEYGARDPAERLPGVEAAAEAIEESTAPDDSGDHSADDNADDSADDSADESPSEEQSGGTASEERSDGAASSQTDGGADPGGDA